VVDSAPRRSNDDSIDLFGYGVDQAVRWEAGWESACEHTQVHAHTFR